VVHDAKHEATEPWVEVGPLEVLVNALAVAQARRANRVLRAMFYKSAQGNKVRSGSNTYLETNGTADTGGSSAVDSGGSGDVLIKSRGHIGASTGHGRADSGDTEEVSVAEALCLTCGLVFSEARAGLSKTALTAHPASVVKTPTSAVAARPRAGLRTASRPTHPLMAKFRSMI
jgi:hypothetical protein